MSSGNGLDADLTSWVLFLGLVVLWLWSLRILEDWSRLGWKSVPMSLFGYVWLGFGIDFVMRFPLLCWDSFVFGNMTPRLADAGSEQVNTALYLTALYFGSLLVAYRVGRGFIAKLVRVHVQLPAEGSKQAQVLLAIFSTIGIVLSSGYIPVPVSVVTPLGIVGSLWVVPACFAWWDRFQNEKQTDSRLCWALLLPGLLRVILSPYRENLLMPVIVIVLAAIFAGRRVRITLVLLAAAALFFLSSIIISGYRQYLWEGYEAKEAVESSEHGYTLELAPDAKWVQMLSRFHGFDSLLLTIRYVPDFLPHSERNVFVDAFVRGVVPRAVLESKEGSTRGVTFGQSIWAFESDENRSGAAIAPSMPGDLFDAGGMAFVALGAVLWGLLLGSLDGWKARISHKAAAALVVLFAVHCAASVERDYAHVVSTTIQYLIVLFIVAKLLGVRRGERLPDLSRRRA